MKSFSCWNQLLTLMFGRLSNRESLRDLIVAINAHQKKSYHLGFGKHVSKSNLAKATKIETIASSRILPTSLLIYKT